VQYGCLYILNEPRHGVSLLVSIVRLTVYIVVKLY